MLLQRLLLFIAKIGILLSIYGANSHCFNSLIQFYLNNWAIKIPNAPTEWLNNYYINKCIFFEIEHQIRFKLVLRHFW
jgi:hypothetical protein